MAREVPSDVVSLGSSWRGRGFCVGPSRWWAARARALLRHVESLGGALSRGVAARLAREGPWLWACARCPAERPAPTDGRDVARGRW